MHTKELYAELLHLTEIYLLRECSAQAKFLQKSAPINTTSEIKKEEPEQAFKEVDSPAIFVISSPPSVTSEEILSKGEITEAPQNVSIPSQAESKPEIAKQVNSVATTEPEKKIKKFILEPITPLPPPKDYQEIGKLFAPFFPREALASEIPDDTRAQKNKNMWMEKLLPPAVIILSFQKGEEEPKFLKNIARSISLSLGPTKIVSATSAEEENGWKKWLTAKDIRLIIASDYEIYLNTGLMQFYRKEAGGRHFLHNIPLLLLSDLSLYLKNPELKPLLWRAICNEFHS